MPKEEKSVESKKANIIRLLQILESRTDAEHPLKQSEILAIMEKEYGMVCERKAITRNEAILRDMGYEIVSTRKGCYLLTRQFEQAELRLLIDSVLGSRYMNDKHSKDLIAKLASLGGANFRSHARHIYTLKNTARSDNTQLFLNVEVLDEAIEKHLKVEFYFNKYGNDKRLHKSSENKRLVNPYQLIVHNQRYYLAGNVEEYNNLIFFRLERITDIVLTDKIYKPLRSLPGYENGVNWGDMVTKLPYLYPEKTVNVVMVCEPYMIDELVDWFGFDFKVRKLDNDKLKVELVASQRAMEYWLVQYGTGVEVLEPKELRENVINKIKEISKKYKIM